MPITTQILVDNAQKTVAKAVGIMTGATTSNTLFVGASTLFGANASKFFMPTIMTKLQYAVKCNGTVQLEWSANGGTNTVIQAFSGYQTGYFEMPLMNNAVAANGDLNINVASLVAGETFDFTVTI